MLTDKEVYDEFIGLVNIWWNNLTGTIKSIVNRGNVPVLVALSRKMPRFLEWAKNYVLQNNADTMNGIGLMESAEVVTELALPFLFHQSKPTAREFVILDDVIVHGTTMHSVCNDIFLMTATPVNVSCIFRLRQSRKPLHMRPAQFDSIPVIEDEKAQRFIDIISKTVEATQLPIDMEFPVFNIKSDGEDIVETFRQLKENVDAKCRHSYFIGSRENRFTVDISREEAASADNDFSKVRFFLKNDRIALEMISPHIIPNSRLVSIEAPFFQNHLLQILWDDTTMSIRQSLSLPYQDGDMNIVAKENMKRNSVRSLCVWANYLYSLVCLAKNRGRLLDIKIRRLIDLSCADLSLIVGMELAKRLSSLLNSFCFKTAAPIIESERIMGVPNEFAPQNFEKDLKSHKVMALVLGEDESKVLQGIFAYQHYSNKKFSNPQLSYERLFFGETYDSLWKALSPLYTTPENREQLSEWIDRNIDAGYVVPKYENVRTSDGVVYWRRYFHAGIRRMSESVC